MSLQENRDVLTSLPVLALPSPEQQYATYPDAATLMLKAGEAFAQLQHANFREQPPVLDRLYQAWATASLQGYEAAAEAIGTADSLERGRSADLRRLVDIGFGFFNREIFQVPSLLTLPAIRRTALRQTYGMYGADTAEWLPIKTEDDRLAVFARREVVEEAAQLEQMLAAPEATLFHTTSSAALGGILRAGSILSALKARERGETIASGEYLTLDGHKDERLGYVYASNSVDINTSYGSERWFGEYQITFGAMARSVEQAITVRTGRRPNYLAQVSNGHEIPDELSLDHITAVYTQWRHKALVQRSLEEAGLNLPVISTEATTILRNYVRSSMSLYPDIYRSESPQVQSATDILRKEPIILG